jgi:antitoxin component YwqK of YwqJK toxin-antitoxin module
MYLPICQQTNEIFQLTFTITFSILITIVINIFQSVFDSNDFGKKEYYMNDFTTQYGILSGISRYSNYKNGQLDSLCLENENKIHTSIGILIPRYQDYTGRRKTIKCLSFYPSGNIKSIDLQEQTSISTSLGNIEVELVTFYENGIIKRVFPRNGALSGFWSEDDEAQLCKTLSFSLLDTNFNLKINSIFFYRDGNVKSVSFFPGETALVPTPCGDINTRIGISLSANGNILTLEPAAPVEVLTPIGVLHAYKSNAIGIHADRNSLVFDGKNISELVSSTDIIKITDKTGTPHYLSPSFLESSTDPEKNELVPMKVLFHANYVKFITSCEFKIDYKDIADITINTMPLSCNECTDCASCGKCS